MKSRMNLILPVIILFLLGSCSQKVAFERSSVVPAADADVKVKQDRNGNYELEVRVQNLAHPENLSPAKQTYVVWMESSDRNIHNLGELKVGNNLNGALTAVTPHSPSKVFITAEDSPTLSYPGSQIVLEANRF